VPPWLSVTVSGAVPVQATVATRRLPADAGAANVCARLAAAALLDVAAPCT
jgi:hypothetical protein